MTLETPIWLWCALGLVGVSAGVYWTGFFRGHWRQRSVSSRLFEKQSRWFWVIHLPWALFVCAVAFLGIALSGPYQSEGHHHQLKEGIDIMILLDVSYSMMAEDFKPNRLEVAKQTVQDFTAQLVNDRVGLIIYSGETYVQYPLSFDHQLMNQFLPYVQSNRLKPGTAIGDALAQGVQRLKSSESSKKRSQVVILLTDGDSNAGTILPLQAAQMAKEAGIPVYTIAVGKEGQVPQPVYLQGPGGMRQKVYQMVQSRVNYEVLEHVSQLTQGHAYRVDNPDLLSSVFQNIQHIEKSKLPTLRPSSDRIYLDHVMLWVTLLCFVISFLIEKMVLRVVT